MEMDLFQTIQQAATQDAQKRQQAIQLLEGALELLKGGVTTVTYSGRAKNGPPSGERPNYIQRIIEMTERRGQPMSPADITRELAKLQGFEQLRRPVIERAIFMEMRKQSPRLKKFGPGLYGAKSVKLPKSA